MDQKPSIGRIVHYRPTKAEESNGAPVFAAIITRVWDNEAVNLTVFPDLRAPFMVGTRIRAHDQPDPGQWFWPPRA